MPKTPDYLLQSNKKKSTAQLINQALHILDSLGVPLDGLTNRRLEKMAMAFLAVCNVKKPSEWITLSSEDKSNTLTTREIIKFINDHFEENISPGSYDDIRRKDLKFPVLAGIVQRSAKNPNANRNNPTRSYALSGEYVSLLQDYGSSNWFDKVEEFMSEQTSLKDKLEQKRELESVEVLLPSGDELVFSPGEHNQLQKAVIEEFLAKYGHHAEVLYVGDASKKFLPLDEEKLATLQFFELSHGELPDVVAYSEERNWIYLIEAVHSSGPISPARRLELERLLDNCTAEPIFVTAFLNRSTFRKFAPDIAWETEVWIADTPEHMIHFDGDKFLGPYK